MTSTDYYVTEIAIYLRSLFLSDKHATLRTNRCSETLQTRWRSRRTDAAANAQEEVCQTREAAVRIRASRGSRKPSRCHTAKDSRTESVKQKFTFVCAS